MTNPLIRLVVSVIGLIFVGALFAIHGPAMENQRALHGKVHTRRSALEANIGLAIGACAFATFAVLNARELCLESKNSKGTDRKDGTKSGP